MRDLQSTFSYKWFDRVWNNLQRNAIDDLVNNNAIIHNITDESSPDDIGIDAFKKFYDDFTGQYRNIRVNVDDVVSQDDMETTRCTVTAFHITSNQEVIIRGTTIVRIRNGKIAEAWNYFASQPLRNLVV